MNLKGIIDIKEYILKDKRRVIALIIAAVGILILFFSFGSEKDVVTEESVTLSEYKAALEKELIELCSSIDGVGKCKISVSFSQGEIKEYKSGKAVGTTPPRILGIGVVCEGGDDSSVKQAVKDCLTALFDIGSNRVSVQKLEK